MTLTDMPPKAAPPAAARPAPGLAPAAATAKPGGAAHTVTRQEYDAARAAVAKLTRLGQMITRALMSIGGGALIFTCANVTLFAMKHHIPGWIAWMLDPMASLALITVLYVDGVLAEQGGQRAGTWPFLLRWFAGISTWLMNSWTSLFPDGQFAFIPQHPDAGGLLLHSVAPFLLITMAEASSGYRKYLARRLVELRETVQAYEDQALTAKQAREQAALDAQRAEHEALREQQRAAERAALAQSASKAEIERLRTQSEIEGKQAQREAEKEQREHAAKIELLREQTALENAKLLREAEQARIDQENEDAKARREQENEKEKARLAQESEDARLRSEAEREALRIKAEAEAQAAILLAQEQVRQRQAAEKARLEKDAAEAAEKRRKAEERAAARQQRFASQTARASRSGSSRFPSEIASQTGGTIPRELRSQLREQAEREVARLMLEGSQIDQQAIGERYGKGETWVGDRVRSAKKRLANDSEFENEVITSALEDEMPVSEETRDSDTQAGEDAA